jgi:excisionase family DNA binding protein
MEEKTFLTVKDLAQILGISRIAVFKKIKAGQIKAIKIGRNYAISQKETEVVTGLTLSDQNKTLINQAVKGTVSEYGEALRLLGKE